MNTIKEIHRINDLELKSGIVNTPASWHKKYANSAWVYVGNLPIQLTEGDILAVMSQWGEIEDINLVREDGTGKSKGFAFLKYEDARSCILAVDNFNGSILLGRSMRVDHVENYRLPKNLREKDEEGGGGDDQDVPEEDVVDTGPGHAYKGKELANDYDISQGQDLFAPVKETNALAHDGYDEISNGRDEALLTKKERKEAKLRRKEERAQLRREKEARREEREEKRRLKRSKKLMEKDGDDGDDHGRAKKHHKKNRDRSRERDRDRDRHHEKREHRRRRYHSDDS